MINWNQISKSVNCVLLTNRKLELNAEPAFYQIIPDGYLVGIERVSLNTFKTVSDDDLTTYRLWDGDVIYDRPAVGSNPEPDNYSTLRNVLDRAFEQASSGKGQERHGQNLPFDKQPMQQIQDLVGEGFALGQAIKKMQESQRLSHDAAIRELLGAINYIAGVIIHKECKL